FKEFTLVQFFESIGFLFLFMVIFFFFNFIITKNELTFGHSYAYFFFTICLTYFLSVSLNFKILIQFLIYMLLLRRIYSLQSPKKVLQKLFDSGFWLGILFLLEPFMALFLILLYATIFLHQKTTVRTLFSPLVGIAIPLLLYYSYCLYINDLDNFTSLFLFETCSGFSWYTTPYFSYISIAIITSAILAIFLRYPKIFAINDAFKKSWILLIIHLLVAFLCIALMPNKTGDEFLFILFPSTVLMANGLEAIKSNLIKNSVFYLFLLSVLSVILPL
ncbi:MAG: DUF6427 family protein, partial [Polaribacter sp.]